MVYIIEISKIYINFLTLINCKESVNFDVLDDEEEVEEKDEDKHEYNF